MQHQPAMLNACRAPTSATDASVATNRCAPVPMHEAGGPPSSSGQTTSGPVRATADRYPSADQCAGPLPAACVSSVRAFTGGGGGAGDETGPASSTSQRFPRASSREIDAESRSAHFESRYRRE